MDIGNLHIKNAVFLAPMAGVTDAPFREICREMGCEFAYTEMVSAKGLYYGNEKTKNLLMTSKSEDSIAVQIFGSDPAVISKVCEMLNKLDHVCLIDINMGCPVNKIVKNGDGSALMKNPNLAYEIVNTAKEVSKKPVTVKIRKGFDSKNINAVEFAMLMEKAGADAITIHGRTREQMYSGKADWNIIKKVKEKLHIPVIGNGDIFSHQDALKMKLETGCDGVMVARGAMGNPWIFNQINSAFKGKEVYYPSQAEKIDVCIRHYKKAILYLGEQRAVKEMRKHIMWYIKGMKNCNAIKDRVNKECSSQNVINILKEYKNYLNKLS